MAGPRTQPSYECGMCGVQSLSRAEHNTHIANHPEIHAATLTCSVCNSSFPDSLELENHTMRSGHGTPTSRAQQMSTRAQVQEPISCDRCTNTFRTQQEYNNHRSFQNNGPCADHNHRTPPQNRVGYRDPSMPQQSVVAQPQPSEPDQLEVATGHSEPPPSDLDIGEHWCPECKRRFPSMATYNNHIFRCITVHGSSGLRVPTVGASTAAGSQTARSAINSHSASNEHSRAHEAQFETPTPQRVAPAPDVASATLAPIAPRTQAPGLSPSPSVTAPAPPNSFACDVGECHMSFGSEAGLNQHKRDRHGIGGPRLDITGRDAWMMSQRERNRMRVEGILPAPSGPSNTRGRGGGGHGGRGALQTARPPPPQPARTMVRPQHHPTPPPIPAFGTPPRASMPFSPSPHHMPVQHAPARNPTAPAVREPGGPLEIQQAKYLGDKILSLLIQSDIFIHNNGSMTVCGIDWTRIGVERQPELIGMFDSMCHLPKIIQHEFVPHPKAFLSDYQFPYPSADFEPSPTRDGAKPGLGIVALACSKVALANGLEEVVKLSAIDVMTGRILMNHLVCTDPKAKVRDWRSSETGLFSWGDMEHARTLNYKVFKGWSAARSALWKYVDKDTIVVGHNLRSDLDALRMVHGRAVDVAKVAEKAAKGPLSKAQLSLDSICRDFPSKQLKSDPEYGRDTLMNAFGIREMGLWVLKNKEPFEKKIRQRSLEYQRVMPHAAAAA